MEIRGINYLCFPGIYPEFLQKCLAVWAVAVAAGIVMEVQVSAVRADGNIAAEFPGLAGHEGGGGLPLYRGGAEESSIALPGIVKDLLELKPEHG